MSPVNHLTPSQAAQRYLPLVYRHQFAEPFLATLGALGAEDLRALQERPCCADVLRPLYDIAQAILQRQDPAWMGPTCAFQEVISDLYDGFLSAEDRRGVKPPDRAVIAPLAPKWGAAGAIPIPRAKALSRSRPGPPPPSGSERVWSTSRPLSAPGAGLLGHAGPRDLRARHPACR